MAHIAVITSGSVGFSNACFELMARLEREGHRVSCMSCLDIREKVEKQGFSYVQLPRINYYPQFQNRHGEVPAGWLAKLINHFSNSANRYRQGAIQLRLKEYKKILQETNPDLALINMELHELVLTSYELKIPTKILSTWYNLNKVKGLPPIRSAIIPGVGKSGTRFGIFKAWSKIKLKIYAKLLYDRLFFNGHRRDVLRLHAKKIGFPLGDWEHRYFPSLFIYKNLPTLSMTIQEMELPHNPVSNMRYLGMMVYKNRADSSGKKLDRDLASLIREKKEKDYKLIYCSISTHTYRENDFLSKVIEAVASKKDWKLLISTGSKIPIDHFENVPDNVHIFEWLPQLEVLQHADCSLNHGGGNSINEAIYHEVPMLIYSGGFYDQNGCAARVAYHGLGIMGEAQDDTVKIRQNIEEVLKNDTYRQKVREMKQINRTYENKPLTPVIFD